MCFNLDNERMRASSRTYNKLFGELEVEYDVPRPQNGDGQPLCDLLMMHVGEILRKYAKRAAREGYRCGLRAAADDLPDDPEDGLYVRRGVILIKTASVGRIKTPPFNSWAHV